MASLLKITARRTGVDAKLVGRVYTVTTKIHFCYGHRLLDYDGKCAHAHGHNAVAEVELSCEHPDECGMVIDFNEVEDRVSDYIEAQLDHRMLLRQDDPLVEALRAVGEDPFIMESNPTAENIARLIFDAAHQRGLAVTAVRLWETIGSMAEYRPPQISERG
jgi:6-pyruvoyltetrahydropterin/6-carboxytetrahydropterin synthase